MQGYYQKKRALNGVFHYVQLAYYITSAPTKLAHAGKLRERVN